MMGRSHVLVGVLGWLAGAPAAATALGYPLTVPETLAGTLLCGGAALLPDIDHPRSSVADTLGPVTGTLAEAVAAITGGHRQATHSLAGCAAFAALATLAVRWWVGVFLLFLFCGAWFLRLLGPDELDSSLFGWGEVVVAAVAAWWIADTFPGAPWMIAAVGAGAGLHLAGDLVTKGTLPVLWPVPWRCSLGLFRAGGPLERHAVTPLLVLGNLWLLWFRAMG